MPLGSFRLTGLSRRPGLPPSARASAAAYSNYASNTENPSIYDSITPKFGNRHFWVASTFGPNERISYGQILVNPTSSSFYFNSSNAWTVEWWESRNTIYWNSGNTYRLLGIGASGFGSDVWITSFGGGTIIFNSEAGTNNPNFNAANNAWTKIAIVSTGAGELYYYINGSRVATRAYSSTSTGRRVMLGSYRPYAYSMEYRADELRISNMARYTGTSYTVPTAAFTNDANTLGLFHFDSTTNFNDDTA